jgi:hypothetical protein
MLIGLWHINCFSLNIEFWMSSLRLNSLAKMNLATFLVGLFIFGTAYDVSLAAKLDPTGWILQRAGESTHVDPPTKLHVVSIASQIASQIAPTNSIAQTVIASQSEWQVLFDNNPSTFITLTNLVSSGDTSGILIDMGQTNAVDRIFINGTNNGLRIWPNSGSATNLPLGLIVAYVGNNPQALTNVSNFVIPYDAGNPINESIDMRFSPVLGRYVRLELQTQVAWGVQYWPGHGASIHAASVDTFLNVGKLEIYGSTNTAMNINAVVLETNAPLPLSLAASDLSYYIGELTGAACPIIAPAQANGYSGNLYWVNDLAYLAQNYTQMTNNIASGILPTNEVNVVLTNGNVVLFSSWPYRCVLWSVWEFLERQGVRWVYPDAHGDYVPARNGVNLSMLPLQYNSPVQDINASWYITDFMPWPSYDSQPVRQEYLYFLRNRWKNSWGAIYGLGGLEIPAAPATGIMLNSNYTEGFSGFPENFNTVMPDRILSIHTNWWGWPGPTSAPTNEYETAFNMCTTDLISWVADKVIACDASSPLKDMNVLNNNHRNLGYNLLPMDATLFSSDSNSLAANALYDQPYGNTEAYADRYPGYSWAGAYYKLVAGVAQIATNQTIGGLAYADLEQAPVVVYPSNVVMTVCLYGAPNLPMNSPANAGTKLNFMTWHTNCSRLATYDYALLFTDYYQTNLMLPVPMVSATVDRARFLAGIGALSGECQGTDPSIQYNPWDFYAYPRIRWNTNYASSNLLTEFFNGYYKEAAAPMLAYYQAMENFQYSNNVTMHYVAYEYWANPGTFPRFVLFQMQTNLQYAESIATNWDVKNRLNDVQNSFKWLTSSALNINDLTTLTNFSNFTTVPADGSTVTLGLTNFVNCVPARTNICFYNAGLIAGAWNLNGTSRIQQTLNFTNAGDYRVDVIGGVSYFNGGYSNLRVYLGGSAGTTNFDFTYANVNLTNSFVLNVPMPTAFELVLEDDSFNQFFQVSQVRVTSQ